MGVAGEQAARGRLLGLVLCGLCSCLSRRAFTSGNLGWCRPPVLPCPRVGLAPPWQGRDEGGLCCSDLGLSHVQTPPQPCWCPWHGSNTVWQQWGEQARRGRLLGLVLSGLHLCPTYSPLHPRPRLLAAGCAPWACLSWVWVHRAAPAHWPCTPGPRERCPGLRRAPNNSPQDLQL